jgi:hypothetical protein
MDISSLGSAGAGGFTGFGGMSSLPAGVQSKLMIQSQSLNLLPPVSSEGLGGSLDIYAAVGQQALGALAGRSAVELSQIMLAGRAAEPPQPAASEDAGPAKASGPKDPPLGSTLDAILKENGFVPQEENPYAFRKDFFADKGSLGGLLNSLG